MHTNEAPKCFGEELTSDPATLEAYNALKGLYPKSTSETRIEDIRHYHYLQAHIYHAERRMTLFREALERIQNRTFMEKLKDLFSK